jgi:hypothetical protein
MDPEAWTERLTSMRSLESRIVKLETRTARPDEMLVVWRRPDGSVAEALKDVTFARGDKVICAEWFENSPMPAPTWLKDRLRMEMDEREYDQILQSMDRVARLPRAKRETDGFAAFPSGTLKRAVEMTDAELIHAVLGVRT